MFRIIGRRIALEVGDCPLKELRQHGPKIVSHTGGADAMQIV
jgi:hypothetical protein